MTRDTAVPVSPHEADNTTQRGRSGKVGDKNKDTAKISAGGPDKRSGPRISALEGLTPVENRPPGHAAGATMKNRGRNSSTINNNNSLDEVTPLNMAENGTVTAPMAEVEKVDDPDMCEVDLGDGSSAGPIGKFDSHGQNGASGADPIRAISPKDEPDGLSTYSYYMESDFRYYFQHPWARLFIAYFVTLCNFLIYAEDPVAHSRTECNIPVIGNSFAFLFMRYPPNAWSVLKVVLWLIGITVGIIVGKVIVHTLLFNRVLRLKMFSDDKGSWMISFLTTIFCLFIFSYVYNLGLLIGGTSTEDYAISPYMNIANHIFMKAAAAGTWCGDFFTAWMVTDMMLQEKLYPGWGKLARKWWNKGYRRIVLFWAAVLLTSFIVLFVIATDYIQWDRLNHDFLHTNELSRAFLASAILVMDIIIVMQDWDFPHFIGAIDIKLPGVNTAHINFKIPQLLKKLEYWHVHISGKWFNYGILFMVILLDLNMWKNQIFFAPYDYGQYVDTEGRIHSVEDAWSIANQNQTIFSYAYRNETVDPLTGRRFIEEDNIMNARYNDYSIGVKAIAFFPSIAVFITFGVLVWVYGRMPKPTKDDPYAGRLKKRKKHRFSVRLGWKRLRKRLSTTAVALTAFKASGGSAPAGGAAANASEVDATRLKVMAVSAFKSPAVTASTEPPVSAFTAPVDSERPPNGSGLGASPGSGWGQGEGEAEATGLTVSFSGDPKKKEVRRVDSSVNSEPRPTTVI